MQINEITIKIDERTIEVDEITIKKVITILQDINEGVKDRKSPYFSGYGLFFDVKSVKLQKNLEKNLSTGEKIYLIEKYLSETKNVQKKQPIQKIMNQRNNLLSEIQPPKIC